MMYIAPIAPPALLNTQSFSRSVFKETPDGGEENGRETMEVVGESWGNSVVRFARIWSIMSDVLVPWVATALWASSCRNVGSKTYHLSCNLASEIEFITQKVTYLDAVEPAASRDCEEDES